MNTTAKQLGLWFWHLVPANPILVRVVYGASKRPRHLWLRFGYLGILLFVVVIGAFRLGSGRATGSLAELAKHSSSTFKLASIAQLALMCFLAPVFTAGAITQEKDSRTFNILLATPLSNAQIVFGSLLSRLYFVVVLLLAGLPIFLITRIYGGVTTTQIMRSFVLAGATAAVTGALAIAISMIRVGTRRTIFSFYLMIGLYLLSVYAAGTQWKATWVPEAPINVAGERMSWLAPFHPFLALDVALNRVQAPPLSALGGRSAPARYLLAYPQTCYVVLTLSLALLLTVLSMFFVRRSAKLGEVSFLNNLLARVTHRDPGERSQKPRRVWNNPIAWREAVTRASAASRGVLRYAIVGGGLLVAVIGLIKYHRGTLNLADTRTFLVYLVGIEFGIIMLIATNTAATAITKERESNSMDILLTTPLRPVDLVWGKLRGLVSFTLPPICVPIGSLLLFTIADWVARSKEPVVFMELWLELAVLMVAYAAFACMLGLHFSLRIKRTVKAVMVSVGVMTLICLAAFFLAHAVISSLDAAGAFVAAFTPLSAVDVLIRPQSLFNNPADLAASSRKVRVLAIWGACVAGALVYLVVAGLYKSMVRNFDMIVRKQSGL